jgi:cytochrome oxidase assembly protein ShyY1
MAAAAKLKNPAPVQVNIAKKQAGVYPMGGKVEANIQNNHRQYAIFWYVMAALSQIIFVMSHWQPVRRRQG